MMNEQRFETRHAPQVTVSECGGALVVGSWKETAVHIHGADFTTESAEIDAITLASKSNLTLTVPEKAELSLETVMGSVTIKHVDGRITIGTVGGDITLNDVGRVTIKQVAGKLLGENINGAITLAVTDQGVILRNVADVGIKKAAATVSVQFANGAVLLEQAAGVVTLHTISGDVIVRQAGEANLSNLGGKNEIDGIAGSLRLAGGLADGEHHFAADGDIFIAWPLAAPLTLVAEAAVIDNQLTLSNETTTKLDGDLTRLTGHIEQGKPFVTLKTMANIGLKPLSRGEKPALTGADFDFTPPPPTLAEIVETAVHQQFPNATPEQIKKITAAIKTNLAAPSPPDVPSPPSAGKIAAEKAQRKVEESLQKVKETMMKAGVKLTQPTPKTAPTPSQTQILQLLQNGRITMKQANTLLNQLKT